MIYLIALAWIALGILNIWLDNKEYDIIKRAGYYRRFPTRNIERIMFIVLSPFYFCIICLEYRKTKKRYNNLKG